MAYSYKSLGIDGDLRAFLKFFALSEIFQEKLRCNPSKAPDASQTLVHNSYHHLPLIFKFPTPYIEYSDCGISYHYTVNLSYQGVRCSFMNTEIYAAGPPFCVGRILRVCGVVLSLQKGGRGLQPQPSREWHPKGVKEDSCLQAGS